ncbi:hypothetical protein P280DRAFT_521115 [Massarina eburnea CBS 473.64]|uniref:Ribosome biogenesis protein SLX9 n=1 Tax=Massarina eburnea CBS 473.64 TaxID=1395130 RepID=A0A6A6RQG2_9PLEO|nr:hypothetical protein P280DRAFT_521115 [Massarina eburnea CBS 473.64]
MFEFEANEKDEAQLSKRTRNMAPIISKKRTTARAKSARISRPQPTLPLPDDATTLFPSSKRDKRTIKHSAFVGKIEKPSSTSTKRRRPNKKLVANLESLADALPDFEQGNGETGDVVVGQAKVRRKPMKSMKSRPGATKRKEKLEKVEKERFNANLALMAGSRSTSAVTDRWAALKSHVQSSMEVKPEFVKK